RSAFAQKAWKVPTLTAFALSPASAVTRSRISPAALFVKVTARIENGSTPRASRWAMRAVITRVLPVPAPASTSSGPSVASTASRCAGLRRATTAPSPGAERPEGAAVLGEDRAKGPPLYQEFSVGNPAATQADVPPTTL